MANLSLYLKYAWRSLQRGGQRTFFAALCIAVGVAALVALQSTGDAIQATVTGDARASARADVLVTNRQRLFTTQDLEQIEKLKQNQTIVDYTTSIDNAGITVTKPDGSKSNDFNSYYLAYVVDPAKFPFYGKLDLTNPQGKSLNELLNGTNQIVLNQRMATAIGAKAGDKIKAVGDSQAGELTVVGILTTQTTTPPTNSTSQAEFTGYGYINLATAKNLFKPETLVPETLYVKTAGDKSADKAKTAIEGLSTAYAAQTSTERNSQTKQAFKGISDMLVYVGLISLLIGSVGVVNTMLVVIGRRSTEIATIKALGMEEGQTVRLFMIESAILGVIGSIAGVFLGELLYLLTSKAAEGFVNQTLEFQIFWQPIAMGLLVGIVTAVVFGLLPAYSASRIPPAQVLRQKTNALPKISFLATVVIIAIMTVVMGVLAGIIFDGQFGLGIAVAFGALVACALLVLLFSGLLWLVGKIGLPFGLNYKLARRNLSRGRAKNAVTMLVMMLGIFSISLVIILASSLKETLQSLIEQSFGYTARVITKDDSQNPQLQSAIDGGKIGGLQNYVVLNTANVRLISAGGVSADDLIARKLEKDKAAGRSFGNAYVGIEFSSLPGLDADKVARFAKTIEGVPYANDNEAMINKDVRDNYGIKIGDTLVFQDVIQGKQFSLKVVGVIENKNVLIDLPMVTTFSKVQSIPGHVTEFDLNVERSKLPEAIKYLQTNFTGANVADLSFITNVINRIIDNVTAFPVLLALLCLIAGAVLIANNVALVVLERRTEMGVMKSVGATNGRVLSIINWESGIVSGLGGILGFLLATGLASAIIGVFGTADNPAVLALSPIVFIGMPLLAVGLAIAATLVSAWGAAHEKPMVVLRYE